MCFASDCALKEAQHCGAISLVCIQVRCNGSAHRELWRPGQPEVLTKVGNALLLRGHGYLACALQATLPQVSSPAPSSSREGVALLPCIGSTPIGFFFPLTCSISGMSHT
jgi:hypothetical protein